MTSDEFEDPTVPSQNVPGGSGDAPEERTVPSSDTGAGTGDGEDRTVPALDANAMIGTEQLIGKTIGGCRIDKMLGRGAMGAVYKARQIKLDRDVAVKVIRPEMMSDARMLKRFEVEARTVGKFNSANVVMVHDVGFELGVHYLVMEFVQGKNLREHVKLLAGGRLPAGEALPLIRQACKGLEEARRLSVVHRDIKPDNLMLTDQGVLKIADFGIAKPVEDEFNMTLTSELIGTPLYMSPEQCQGGADIDFRSDMYSLGATFFYLLTGEPPIRASSVYELIQTKTKLENLCLWKALPELDENHPLSRVIERMTANDRDDRYESYEELLNDLVLVEAGETIRTKVRRIKKANADADRRDERDAGDDGKKGSGALVAVVALLLLGGGGGGYWWWSQQQQDPQQGPSVNVVDNPTADQATRAQQQLGLFRERLRTSGPGGTLADELGALSVPEALAREATQLRDDIAAGNAVEASLGKLERPVEPALPFDDVESYFASVDDATALPATAGAEVREWLRGRKSEARAEAQLGSASVATLLGSFATWQTDRGKVAGDKARLAELGSRLATIEAGRLKLYDLFREQRERLDRDLPGATLQSAREGLSKQASKPVGDADAAARLTEIRAEFLQNGPLKTLRNQVDAIVPIKVEDERMQRALVLEIDQAFQIEDKIRKLTFPTSPRPPFADVADYYAQIDLALEVLVDPDGGLPPWAAQLQKEHRREQRLRDQVVRACKQQWNDWQVLAAGDVTMRELKNGRDELVESLSQAKALFPGDETEQALAAAVSLDALDQALAAAEAKILRAELEKGISEINDRLQDVGSLRDWNEKQAGLDKESKALRARLASMAEPGDLDGKLRRIETGCEKWRRAEQALSNAAQHFGGGNLTACTTAIGVAQGAGTEGRTEFGQLQNIVDTSRAAFEVLASTLDIPAARQKLDQAAGVLATTTSMPPVVGTKLQNWQSGLRQLEQAASGMIAIAAADGVDAFFLAPTETSYDQFRAFQRQLKAAAQGADDAARLAAVGARLSGVQSSAQQFGELLRWTPTGDGQQPIDQVRWFEAHAFCRWYGKSLPSKAEWVLAAFGPGRKHTYSWGSDWSDDKASRNTVFRKPANVTDGGISWRASNLHHLSDNVSEWLAEAKAGRAEAAGGSCFRRRGATAREHCAGKRFDEMSVSERRSGVGFRPVLRPKDYTQLSWPR